MPDLLIRNLAPDTMATLKANAQKHRRSVNAEVVEIIEREIASSRRAEAFWKRADALRTMTDGVEQTDTADLIREDRDTDHGRD